jgi:hypothetical protein
MRDYLYKGFICYCAMACRALIILKGGYYAFNINRVKDFNKYAKEYGGKKGERIFYATINKGKIIGRKMRRNTGDDVRLAKNVL